MLFSNPSSPFAQPRTALLGNIVSGIIGIGISKLFGHSKSYMLSTPFGDAWAAGIGELLLVHDCFQSHQNVLDWNGFGLWSHGIARVCPPTFLHPMWRPSLTQVSLLVPHILTPYLYSKTWSPLPQSSTSSRRSGRTTRPHKSRSSQLRLVLPSCRLDRHLDHARCGTCRQ